MAGSSNQIYGRSSTGGQGTADQLKGLSLEQLANTEVTTASKEPEEIWKTPAAIYVLTQDDIRRSGATSIPEVLRLVPGVEVAQIDSDHWSIGIRGFGSEFSESVLVLIDGRSVYTPLFGGVYWQVEDTPLDDVERIEVIRGPGGTIWGSNAVNGVINIITKNSRDTQGQHVEVSGGSVDEGASTFRYGGNMNKEITYRFYGQGFLDGPEYHPDGVNFDEWRMTQWGFRTDWSPQPKESLTVQGDIYKGGDGERVAVALYSPPSTEVINSPAHHTGGGDILIHWRRELSDGSDVEVQAYYDRTSRISPQLDEIRDTFDVDFIYHRSLFGGQEFIAGVGGRWSPDTIGQEFATLDFEPHQETDRIYGWFLQDQIPLVSNRLWLILGAKFDHNNYDGQEVQPNARLLWTPTPHQSLWLAETKADDTPSRLDQGLILTDFLLANPAVFLRVTGSKNFKPQELVGTEAGYRILAASRLYLDVAAFRNDYYDLYGYGPASEFVETAPSPSHIILEWPLANALEGDTRGVEIAPDWKALSWLSLRSSYSFLHLFVHDRPGFTDTLNTASDNGSSPHDEWQAQSIFTPSSHWEVDTIYRYESALPAQKVGAYGTADLRFAWHPGEEWEFSVTGQNLFQPHHAEFGSDVDTIVGIRRSVYAKIAWNLGSNK